MFEYKCPFMGQVPASPTVEDMKKLIIDKHITPKFPAEFLAQVHVHVCMYVQVLLCFNHNSEEKKISFIIFIIARVNGLSLQNMFMNVGM